VVYYSRPTVDAYVPNFLSIGLFCRSLLVKNPNFCVFFGLRHIVLSPIGNILTKLNTVAQVQTCPYPITSKSLLCSNAFMAKSGAQSLTFKSETNKQTDTQQTNRHKTQRFWPSRRRVKLEPHQVGMVIEDLEHVLAPLKLLRI